MKACILLQSQYSKLSHAVAINLKERYGIDQFCAYIFSPGAKEFITAQHDIRYNPILVDHELHARYREEQVDMEYIRNFERTYGPPNLWHYFYCDRKLMMSMGPKEESTTVIDPLYPHHEDMLKIFQARAKSIETMLKQERPDFIFFLSLGSLAHLILFYVAKKLGIRTYNIDLPRIGNRMSISQDYKTLTAVEATAHDFRIGTHDTPFHAEAKQFIEHFRKTGSLNLEYYAVGMGQLPKKFGILHPKNITRSIRYLATLTENFRRNHRLFLYGSADMNPVRFIWYKLKQRYRLARGVSDMCSPPDWSEPFVYFPLHYEPELALLLLSPFYFDQISVIRYLARSVPLEYKVYIKEHPAMAGRRPRAFYKELLKLPNVRLIDPSVKGIELLRHTALVATITGTSGWEAILLGKPVITFGNVFYNALSFVRRVDTLEDLPRLVTEQIHHAKYDEKELLDFTAAVFKESVPFDFATLWYENDNQKLKDNPGLRAFTDLLMRYVQEKKEQDKHMPHP